jgi:hypothetical protein
MYFTRQLLYLALTHSACVSYVLTQALNSSPAFLSACVSYVLSQALTCSDTGAEQACAAAGASSCLQVVWLVAARGGREKAGQIGARGG